MWIKLIAGITVRTEMQWAGVVDARVFGGSSIPLSLSLLCCVHYSTCRTAQPRRGNRLWAKGMRAPGLGKRVWWATAQLRLRHPSDGPSPAKCPPGTDSSPGPRLWRAGGACVKLSAVLRVWFVAACLCLPRESQLLCSLLGAGFILGDDTSWKPL